MGFANRLVLFDVDGTLVDVFHVHDRAFGKTLQGLFGVGGSLFDVDFSGDTLDNVIIAVARKKGLSVREVEAKRAVISNAYKRNFAREAERAKVKVLPGVRALLKGLDGKCSLGLVTGSPKKVARKILMKAGLWEHFGFGAFGDEGTDRSQLLKLAQSRAVERGFKRGKRFVVDDSVRGIRLAGKLGFETIAVCTGVESRRQLLAVRPDHLLMDLSKRDKILKIVCND